MLNPAARLKHRSLKIFRLQSFSHPVQRQQRIIGLPGVNRQSDSLKASSSSLLHGKVHKGLEAEQRHICFSCEQSSLLHTSCEHGAPPVWRFLGTRSLHPLAIYGNTDIAVLKNIAAPSNIARLRCNRTKRRMREIRSVPKSKSAPIFAGALTLGLEFARSRSTKRLSPRRFKTPSKNVGLTFRWQVCSSPSRPRFLTT